MLTAFILGNTKTESSEKVFQALKKISSIKEAHRLYSVFNLIARFETETLREFKENVTEEIKQFDKVKSMKTMIVK